MREPNPPADGRSRPVRNLQRFGVGQRHCAAHRIFTGNHFLLQQPQTPARQAATTGTLLLPTPPVAWCQPGRKILVPVAVGEFQTAGRRFRYWGEEFLFKKRVTPSAFTSCSTQSIYGAGRRSSRYVKLSQERESAVRDETTSDKAFGNVIFRHQRYRKLRHSSAKITSCGVRTL